MLSTADFLETLRRYQLLSPEQMAELTRQQQGRTPEPRTLAAELLKRGWLTAYQVNRLLQGRVQELILGHYLLLERLGEGGMGAVYKAQHRRLGRITALKVIRPERLQNANAVRRFQREARAAAQLDHPNVVHALDADEVAGTHVLVLEYVDGIDLARLVHAKGPLPVAQACEYIRQAALGLQHAFERGLVHRDIKPHNLLLTRDGRTVKILDMGLARFAQEIEQTHASSAMTHDGTLMGTPDFVAPEQAQSAHEADIRADLYSLGCTLYFLLTAKVPFPAGSLMQKLWQHQCDEPTPLRQIRTDVSASVDAVVRTLMAKRPEARYQTPAELADALTRALGAAPESLPEVAPAPPPVAEIAAGTVSPASTDSGGDVIATPAFLTRRRSQSRRVSRKLLIGAGGGAGMLVLVLLLALVFRSRPAATPAKSVPEANRGRLAAPRPVQIGPADDAWYRAVAGLPAPEQIDAVLRKLGELNPTFDGRAEHKVEDGEVTELRFNTERVDDISPLRALRRLRVLECRGGKEQGLLSDLTPLQNLRLTSLDCGANPISNLMPLRALPLMKLRCDHTQVADLSPLVSMPLGDLDCSYTPLASLAHLVGLPLSRLDCEGTPLGDLAPLEGMRLRELRCARTLVADLSRLRDMPLVSLSCDIPRSADLLALRSLDLRELDCDFSFWRDNEALRSIKSLERINGQAAADFWRRADAEQTKFERWAENVARLPAAKQVEEVTAELKRRNPDFEGKIEPLLDAEAVIGLNLLEDDIADLSPLRALPALKTLVCAGSGKPRRKLSNLWPLHGSSLTALDCRATAVADLEALRGLALTRLDCSSCRLSDLGPLKGMPLTDLSCAGNPGITSLAPLAGMQLHRLSCTSTGVSDLSPLKGMPLASLDCNGTPVKDLSLLTLLPLEKVTLDYHPWRDATLLNGLKIATMINGVPATQFFKTLNEIDEWARVVRGLRTDEQLRRVTEKLKERNPEYVAVPKATIEEGAITALELPGDWLADLAAVRALPGLRRLRCTVSDPAKARLADLWPLRGLPLTHLRLEGCPVTDLTPLKGMPLTSLELERGQAADLTPLRGMPLKALLLDGCPLADLTPLAELPLKELSCGATKASDLSPLRGLQLTRLSCRGAPVGNLRPLQGSALEELNTDITPWRDAGVLRSMKKLDKINGQPTAQLLAKMDADRKALDDWCATVRRLNADEQVKAVAAELKRRNPGFDGTVTPGVELGVVTALTFAGDDVADISPVRGLPGLKRLEMRGVSRPGKISDLSPLEGLLLEYLGFESNPVTDLTPVRSLPLTDLRCGATSISDLEPLRGLRLNTLTCASNAITDLGPLDGMPLTTLYCNNNPRLTDLVGLRRLPLKDLHVGSCPIKDLSPLKGLPLLSLTMVATQVTDLSPLSGLPLTSLNADQSPIADLSPLTGLPLTSLSLNKTRIRELSALHGMHLQSLGVANTAVSDLTPLRGQPLTALNAMQTYVTDLSPLQGMPLSWLALSGTHLRTLTLLKGMPIAAFYCDYTAVEDITPLKGMPLTQLSCTASRVHSLEALKGAPLQLILCDYDADCDAAVLRAIPTLQNINNQPSQQVLGTEKR